jgi:glycosyltransferase involved in cell wall biosynthesis
MPQVTVILPVYNAEKYLKEAIDSILNQTYTDFELLLINDGSTDSSEKIILSYNDPRIIYIKNEGNKGLIFSLNKGIDLAKGDYIARMDADDISMPERLEKQLNYLEENKNVEVVASTVKYIDDAGKIAGNWKLDNQTTDVKTIRKWMPRENCIAHPSVMGKKELLSRFKYNPNQLNIEDYDLWMRLLNTGAIIAKIPEPLLYYRVHSSSVTQAAKNTALPTLRVYQCKMTYLKERLKEFNFSFFNAKVFFFSLVDGITALKKYFFN